MKHSNRNYQRHSNGHETAVSVAFKSQKYLPPVIFLWTGKYDVSDI